MVQHLQPRVSPELAPVTRICGLSVLTSDYFLATIFALDPKYKYWGIFPVLMRVNRVVRAAVLSFLPDDFKKMLQILNTGWSIRVDPSPADNDRVDPSPADNDRVDPSPADNDHTKAPKYSGFDIATLSNCREIYTKLYKSGVLPVYVRYARTIHPHLCDRTSWESLASIPVTDIVNWRKYMTKTYDVATRGIFLIVFTNADQSGSDPKYVYWHLNKITNNDSRAYINFCDADATTRIQICRVNSNIVCHTFKRKDVACENIYVTTQWFPLPDTGLNIYLTILWFNGSPELVRKFYQHYRAQMPTTGADELLLFCSLFDLDLSIMCFDEPPVMPRFCGLV